MINKIRWKAIGGVTVASESCEVCKGACVTKNIGNICAVCASKVPEHIPDEQIRKYLKTKS